MNRCEWCLGNDLYVHYHDNEWGKWVKDDTALFEFLILESAQAGLSWITILKRREAYKKAYHNFDAYKVANFTEQDIAQLLSNTGIIKHALKIKTSISNAQLFLKIQKEFGSFYTYLWGFMPQQQPIVSLVDDIKFLPSSSPISDAISKDMKKRGFKFFGTTICYAYMQAIGMINNHTSKCAFK